MSYSILFPTTKELFTWNLTFLAHKEMVYASKDESVHSPKKIPAHSLFSEEVSGDDRESDVEEVSEAIFGDYSSSPNNNSDEMGKQHSKDLFKIYDILKKQTGGETREVSSSLSHPPGFTPKVYEIRKENDQGAEEFPSLVNAKVMNNSQPSHGLNIQGLGHKTKKEWIKELSLKNNISFMAIQETKTNCISHMDVKFMWGNSNYNYVYSEVVGNSGGIMCVWEANVFKKDYATISDNFVAIYGTWLPRNSKILFVAIYAPQQASCKRLLWEYVSTLIGRWNRETIILGDFNEVRSIDERHGSCFNPSSSRVFDHFISSSSLVDVKLEGYTFTWSHPSGSKMSKLDRFLVSECIFRSFLLSRRYVLTIIYRTIVRFFSVRSIRILVRFPFSFITHGSALRGSMLWWNKLGDKRMHRSGEKNSIKNELSDIDKEVDREVVFDTNLFRRLELQHNLHDINQVEAKDSFQKSKIKWAIEGEENSKFFYGIINKKRSQLAIREIFDNGLWNVSRDEIRLAVWNCGENKSPGPDGYTFEFLRKYWNIVGPDFCKDCA
uniref:RNA-directed DNA polymerase, eukaryota n=1 Tax=Tanacetum cinerariifolium TaxID=118510 RepID=A0A6L2J3Q1_TANCI|nr:RNA-directed DNA polymerase, eukaryota [Tanacetum cinerariifolium]